MNLPLFKSLTESEFSKLNQEWTQILTNMQSFCFDDSFGFIATTRAQWFGFLNDDEAFHLSLNREPGRSILYGLDHVRCRQSLFNVMPVALRCSVFKAKFNALDLSNGLMTFDENCRLDQLKDVIDIGMGHSVYECDFGHRKLVMKHRPYDTQCAYMRLMNAMGRETFDHFFYQNKFGDWEFSESLGRLNCNDYLLSCKDSESIEAVLARKAALGDVLGIGDRHFENYMIHEKHVLSVDVSIMFWPNNEDWSLRYTAAGLYEITCLRVYQNDIPKLVERWQQFFEHYAYYIDVLSTQRVRLTQELNLLFDAKEARRCSAFLENRLKDPNAYVLSQKKWMLPAFLTCLSRLLYKQHLARLYETNPDVFKPYPLYKMAVLADRYRLSAFLHSEKTPNFFPDLKVFLSNHDSGFLESLSKNELHLAKLEIALNESTYNL